MKKKTKLDESATDKYLRKVLAQKPVTGTFTSNQNPFPKVGDTVTFHGMKFRVTKIYNKRKSREYEAVMKKIKEQQ